MSNRSFFDQPLEQSTIKSKIVLEYFWAWAKVIIGTIKRYPQHSSNIAYIDLFAGPGRYKDGTSSTPLLILEKAVEDPDMCQRLVTIFNDRDEANTRTLETEIEKIENINRLKHAPQIMNEEVGDKIVKMFEQHRLEPTLFFVDPWGYKGLSLRLLSSAIKDWGCDCIFFFNYNRINMGLSNPDVVEHMNALFGEKRANELRQRLERLSGEERELTIVNELALALQQVGGKYVLPFCFKNSQGNRTSHHLIFVSKNIRGYEIMKEIMAGYSSRVDQGVPRFEYNSATSMQTLLFELNRPLDDLVDMLLKDFAGRTLKMKEVYNQHHVGKRYIKKNYKEALAKLEAAQKITVSPPSERRQKRNGEVTFADDVQVTFPR